MRSFVAAPAALCVLAACGRDACTTSTGSAPVEAGTPQVPIPADSPSEGDRPRQPVDMTLPAWSRRFSGAAFELGYSRRLDLLVDRASATYLVGDFKGAVDLGAGRLESAGQSDLLIAKFDAAGRPLWSRRFGDGAEQIYGSAALDPDGNIVIAGVFSGALDFGDGPIRASARDMFLAKLDPDGRPLFAHRFGGEGTIQWAHAVAAGPDGSIVLAGNQEGTIDYGGLSLKTHGVFIFVVKFDAAGRPSWGKTFSGSVDQEPVAVSVGQDGDVALGGHAKRASIDGTSLVGKGMMDVFLARWSAAGELRWAGIFGDPDDQWLSGMAPCPDSGMVLWGPFRGTIDFRGAPLSTRANNSYEFFLARVDRTGRASFSRSLPTSGVVAVDPAGNIVVAGAFEGEMRFGDAVLKSAGRKDVYVERVRADGEPLGSFRAGDEKDQRATAVAVDHDGRALLFGIFDGTLDLGSGAMKSESGKDLFLAKLPR